MFYFQPRFPDSTVTALVELHRLTEPSSSRATIEQELNKRRQSYIAELKACGVPRAKRIATELTIAEAEVEIDALVRFSTACARSLKAAVEVQAFLATLQILRAHPDMSNEQWRNAYCANYVKAARSASFVKHSQRMREFIQRRSRPFRRH